MTHRAIYFAIAVLSLASVLHAQPRVQFANSATTLVTFAQSGQGLTPSNGIVVSLYGAADGTTDESLFVRVVSTNVGFSATPGRFNGGLQFLAAPWTCLNGEWGMFQYRAFESAYGSTYEAALAAGPINGRRAIVGKSPIGRLMPTCSPTVAPNLSTVVGAFTVDYAPGTAFFTVDDIFIPESSNGVATATFLVRLIGDTNETRSVDFATSDGTALAGSDYVSTNGTLTFSPGESAKAVSVTLTPDSPPEQDEDFFLQLSNSVNCGLGRVGARAVITEIRLLDARVNTVVTFNTVSGHHYTVEQSTNLTQWLPVTGATNVLGNGTPTSVTNFAAGCESLTLYRVRLVD